MVAGRTLLCLCLATAVTAAPAAPIATLLPNTVAIEVDPAAKGPPVDPVFAAAVDDALAVQGFTTLQQPGHARLVVHMAVAQVEMGTTTSQASADKPSFTPGFGTRVGASLALSLPTGKTNIVPLVQTRLDVQITRRGEARPVWQGSAVTVRPGDTSDDQLAAKLSKAVFAAQDEDGARVIAVP